MSASKKTDSARTRIGSILSCVIIAVLGLVILETLMISWPLFYRLVLDIISVWVWAALLQLVAFVLLLVLDWY